MKSTMQDVPLSIARILDYGATVHGHTTVDTYSTAEPDHTTFAEIAARAAALAHVMTEEYGIGVGDTISTYMSNCNEHLETMLGAMAMGAVFHPINRLLATSQVKYVINHAEDRVIVCDPRFADDLIAMLPECRTVEGIILIGSNLAEVRRVREAVKDLGIRVDGFEDILDGRPTHYDWPELDEKSPAAICYSTGTTGDPKGVVYSHRSLWLHSQTLRTADGFGIRNGQKFLCSVPIYHVLSWGVPLAAFMSGTPLVFTGRTASAAHLAHVIEDAMPRQAHGAPSMWINLLQHYLIHKPTRMSLREIYSGGSPVPAALIEQWEELYGVDIIHAWGMTETGPVGTVAHPPAGVAGRARARYRESQGRFSVGMQYRLVDDDGHVLPAHDRTTGELQVRGNTITARYHHRDRPERFTEDGWFCTGDIATVTKDGFLTVHDRKNDIIRSGGEWIYSAVLENYLMEHPAVVEVAVIGVPNEQWGQRPLAVVHLEDQSTVPTEDKDSDAAHAMAEDLARTLGTKVPRWMVPEYYTFVDTLPKTSVSKYDKKLLRKLENADRFAIVDISRVL
ncbi:long-chain-fatty-acid--CoA ligase [Corynebacterium sp. 320]|uniref:long-chain-fatty-acid--CoA ligase n=1 Tax=Corynebacterium TaxID=1716 RepID=UPI00125CCCF4|nr:MULTISPECIES: long-chain-fatty-acid--CoA ligase [Corynebacterium]KAB1503945.1 long-chain-fatty-acid--CoA ligase [Corynebacterium sp. 320]KAB1552956.1 long-chain-fatty-acid--CoA ligase [Corynebacterium sp. 321]KAB1553824.1 long-chain-fatty-acid--CoA ligase [Corynebacterium sp. 319]KAB3528081.1 long-chain-fatty-acid--CoA ligase [Corynebacterium sp. 250]KAB3540431.1 long-chain-fatty-acid--CoA ligase [Corynebacterium sp. 366]